MVRILRRSRSRAAALAAAGTAAALTAATAVTMTVLTAGPASAQATGTGVGYLSTDGNQLVDATGAEVRLTGINWFGMETDTHTFHGLWANPPADWRGQLDRMADLGFNTLRIPYTGASLEPGAQADGINEFTNPDLAGLHPLEILDLVIDHAGSLGMRVILDRHRVTTAPQTPLWYDADVPEQSIIDDWVLLAQRYAGNTTVIGADLFNEPHAEGTLPDATGACWGCDDPARDWRLAAERIGNAILAVQPEWLIIVEGVSCITGGLPNPHDDDPATDDDCTWWGGNLLGAAEFPVRLDVPDRLVYSAHDYGISVFDRQPWFDDPDFPNNLPDVWDHYWGYLHKEQTAPVFVGEFGTTLAHPLDAQWLAALLDYMSSNGMSWTYWSWNPNSGDTGGMVQNDWWTLEQAKYDVVAPHLFPPDGPGPTPSPAATSTSSSSPSPSPSESPSESPSPSPTGPPGADCEVTYQVTNSWPGGFQAEVEVRNLGTGMIDGWQVEWTFPGNEHIINYWNTAITQTGPAVTATDAGHNASIAPGDHVAFGFLATANGEFSVPPPPICLT